ncbi:NADH-dependent flavin oxidoreductase [Cohnella phaseoli]|nr:NADH-dependent flavin oxidoreductase [Cohnella phaseoli]
MKDEFLPLFEPFDLPSGVQLKNRIVMAPMTHTASHLDGSVSEVEIKYYVRRARGIAMLITGSASVMANGGFPGSAAADRDELIPSLRNLASAIQSVGTKAVLQIAHGGRKCPQFIDDIVGPSSVPEPKEGAIVPRELTAEEIPDIIRAFGEATRRAIEAGFDGVEIHGANGFLIEQFYSPHANRRNDQWGGSRNERMRFPLAVVDEVRRIVQLHAKKTFIVGYRITPEEAGTPGITMDDTLALVQALALKKMDYLHVAQNDIWSGPQCANGDTRPCLEIIKETAGNLPIIGVGSIRTAENAAQALQTGVPLIALGRELIMDPEWLKKIAQGREDDIKTKLAMTDQLHLEIPDSLWGIIMRVPGWFPVETEA